MLVFDTNISVTEIHSPVRNGKDKWGTEVYSLSADRRQRAVEEWHWLLLEKRKKWIQFTSRSLNWIRMTGRGILWTQQWTLGWWVNSCFLLFGSQDRLIKAFWEIYVFPQWSIKLGNWRFIKYIEKYFMKYNNEI